jgi:hypothetical protein
MARVLAIEDRQDLTGFAAVVYVSRTGNATTDGTALRSAVTGAAFGTLVRVPPGTFDLGVFSLAIPAGVSVWGAGPDLTRVTSRSDFNAGLGPVVVPADQCSVKGMTIVSVLPDTSSFATCVGFPFGTTGRVLLEDLRLEGDTDCLYFWDAAQVTARRIAFQTKWDAVFCGCDGARLDLEDFLLVSTADSAHVSHFASDGSDISNGVGVSASNSLVRLSRGRIVVASAHAGAVVNAVLAENASVTLDAVSISSAATSADAFDLRQAGTGTVVATRCAGSGDGGVLKTGGSVVERGPSSATWDSAEGQQVLAQAAKITTGNVIVADPVGRAVTRVVQGDSYTAERVLRYPMPDGGNWPTDLTGWSVAWTATKRPGNANAGSDTVTTAGVVATPTGTGRLVTVALTAAQTASLASGVGDKGYKLELVATSGQLRATLWLSLLTVDT